MLNNNATLQRALHALAHPVSVAAIVLLLFNDHYLRHAHPSWLTGKLGDFTWLVFAPFIAAVILALLLPRRDRLVFALSAGFIGVWFATAKTIPAVHRLTMDTYSAIVGWEGTLRVDPTDLITLPALLLSAWVWREAQRGRWSLKPLAQVAFALGIVGTLANSPVYYMPQDTGIYCFVQDGATLKAYAFNPTQEFVSGDNRAEAGTYNTFCAKETRHQATITRGDITLHLRIHENEIQASVDGETWYAAPHVTRNATQQDVRVRYYDHFELIAEEPSGMFAYTSPAVVNVEDPTLPTDILYHNSSRANAYTFSMKYQGKMTCKNIL